MAEMFNRSTPNLRQVLPASVASVVYPFTWENNWVLGEESKFCQDTMGYAVLLCGLYCFLCHAGKRLMQSRPAFQLTTALALWNLFLSLFSLIGALRTVPFLLFSIHRNGVYYSVCSPPGQHYGHGAVGVWVTLFIFSKIPELIDTMFIVLRKKPLIFLHWYHHITVLLFCWHAYATLSASGLYFVAMNFSVHAIMYFYYFLTACGYRPKWALLVTVMQLSQMVVGVAVCVSSLYYIRSGMTCDVDRENLKWGIIMYSSYFALFLKFFLERYFFSKSKKKAAQQKKKAE